ncbi:MAG: prephenate dehydratase [Leptolyngbyaceae cyanobacterium CSU_1_4]|nr:prephenate dehydratase [Leptolyngbyaceae cyanobacterium CSU_1_4]
MSTSIAHLGPIGTYAESAAIHYIKTLTHSDVTLHPYPTIAQTLHAVVDRQVDIAVVPVENSIEGGVTFTLDTLWQLDNLQIQQALVLPISHGLLSVAASLEQVQTVYSHPQALSQCQEWLRKFLPTAQQVPANSTTEALQHLAEDATAAAISSQRAAQIYGLPVLVEGINDRPDNCTRFWVLSLRPSWVGSHSSLAFSLLANQPGALVKALQIFATRGINLSRIESRPTKRSLGDYLFFIDLEASFQDTEVQSALVELQTYTETIKTFGSYDIFPIHSSV